jgi:hypothetical protein
MLAANIASNLSQMLARLEQAVDDTFLSVNGQRRSADETNLDNVVRAI